MTTQHSVSVTHLEAWALASQPGVASRWFDIAGSSLWSISCSKKRTVPEVGFTTSESKIAVSVCMLVLVRVSGISQYRERDVATRTDDG